MPTKNEMSRADILKLAAEAQLDPRTVKRAIERGIESLQASVDKDRLRVAAHKLRLKVE
jgi:hypothetical protein